MYHYHRYHQFFVGFSVELIHKINYQNKICDNLFHQQEHCLHQKACWEPNTPPHVITWYHDWFHKKKVAFPELNINRCNNCSSLFITVHACNMKNYFHLDYSIVIWYLLHRSSNFFKILIYWFKTTLYMWLLWWICE